MDRKSFIRSCGMMGIGSCLIPGAVDAAVKSIDAAAPTTPCEDKVAFSQKWVKRFFDVIDRDLDDEKKKEIMETCGQMCFEGSLGGKRPEPVDIDVLLGWINKNTGATAAVRDGNVVDFHYVANERGLKVSDGYCLCPLVESGPKGLSGTYCDCSVGYVKDMFQTYTGKKVVVELLDSLKRGGKTCRFRITLES